MKLAIVGVGNLGSALSESLIRSGAVTRGDLVLVERNANEHERLRVKFQCDVFSSTENLKGKDLAIAVLAVKPQDAAVTCHSLATGLCESTIVISVMAGIPISVLRSRLEGHSKIVRAMPNLGARVGESATTFFCSESVSEIERRDIERILSSFGRTWMVKEERLIDAATAVAGSGPGYICWFAEQIEEAAVGLGFSSIEARELVLQTLVATVRHLGEFPSDFSDLRKQVTSPNGTTAAALNVLRERGADAIMREAVIAAFERALELAAPNPH